MSKGKFEHYLTKISFEDSNYDENIILLSEAKKIVKLALEELLSYKALYNYEEIQVPDAWQPWLKDWFAHEIKMVEIENINNKIMNEIMKKIAQFIENYAHNPTTLRINPEDYALLLDEIDGLKKMVPLRKEYPDMCFGLKIVIDNELSKGTTLMY